MKNDERYIRASAIAYVADALYKKGVYDAVTLQDPIFTSAFAEEHENYSRFQFIDNKRPVKFIFFKDRVISESNHVTGTASILDVLRVTKNKSGVTYAMCILANYYYCLGLREGSKKNTKYELDVFMKKKFMKWLTMKYKTAIFFLDEVKYVCNMLSESLDYINPMYKMSIEIADALFRQKQQLLKNAKRRGKR